MDDKFDADAEIEILEHKMDRIVRLKDQTVRKLQSRLEDAEEKSYKLKMQLQWYESYLTQLRQKREIAEIECHRELLVLHKRLQKLKGRNW